MEQPCIVLSNQRDAPSVDLQPRVRLYSWRIFEFDQEMVLAGFLENRLTCRLTTAISKIDLVGREVTTKSGRLYELLGLPTQDESELVVIRLRLLMSIPGNGVDVTDGIWSAMRSVTN